jgi:hypothetical protein
MIPVKSPKPFNPKPLHVKSSMTPSVERIAPAILGGDTWDSPSIALRAIIIIGVKP